MSRLIVPLLAMALWVPAAAAADLSPEAVRQAIDRGVNYLKRQQRADGSWPEWLGQPGGASALCTLALLNAGVPPTDDAIVRALDYLRKFRPDKTYSTALQTMVFCRAEPKRDLALIRRNVKALERWQLPDGPGKGGWSYPGAGSDNSNAQFAVLALYDAEQAGVEVNLQTWRLARAYWEKGQNADGSWGYHSGMFGTGSMTVAGIGCMVMTSDRVGEPDAVVEGDSIKCCRRSEARADDAVARGLQWLGKNFAVTHNPGARTQSWLLYYLYGVERVGRLTAHRFIGEHDWYREGANYLLKAKGGPLADHWRGSGPTETDERIATSFALLFLSKGRWPVLISKVQHGSEDDWNAHRGDVNNLTRYVEKKWKRDLVWQVIDIDGEDTTIDDLVQSPVLYFCGKNSPLPATPGRQKILAEKIRGYLDRGGFLFAEGYCGGAAFDEGFRGLMKLVFPEPEYQLRFLPPEHPIWRTEEIVPNEDTRPMFGIEFGCRTSVVYCPADTSVRLQPPLSGLWELSRPGRETKYNAGVQRQIQSGLSVGINVLAYATNRELTDKENYFTPPPEKTDVDKDRRNKLAMASLRHPGGCSAAPRALTNLLLSARENLKIRVQTPPVEVSITDPALFEFHLVFMHGRTAFKLTDKERQQLKLYLERGGMLFGNSICASPQFTESFRGEIQQILGKPLQPIPRDDPLLTTEYGGFDLKEVTRRDPQERSAKDPMKAMTRRVPPELEGVKIGDRYAVIFSRFDLSCALEKQDSIECQGYSREDAARIGVNVVLYSLQQ